MASGKFSDESALNLELIKRYHRWLEVQEYSFETRRFYTRVAGSFGRYMGRASLVLANHFDIRDFLVSAARQGHIRFTLKHELHALRVFFDFLNMGGMVPWVAPRFVKIRTPIPRVPRYLSEQQVRRVFDAALGNEGRFLFGGSLTPAELGQQLLRAKPYCAEFRWLRSTCCRLSTSACRRCCQAWIAARSEQG